MIQTLEWREQLCQSRVDNWEKNLIGSRLKELRKREHLSQRDLAQIVQLKGFDIDKNVITRIETNKRFVTDIRLRAIAEVFQVTYEFLMDGKKIPRLIKK